MSYGPARSNFLSDMFGDVDPADQATLGARLVELKKAAGASVDATDQGRVWADTFRLDGADHDSYVLQKGVRPDRARGAVAEIEKAFSGQELSAEVQQALQLVKGAVTPDIQKDWTPSNPVGGTGLTAYDLEAPAKILWPTYTPFRNTVPRTKGQGSARKYKRIVSVTNAGVPGGAASASPFFSSLSATASFGPLTLNRPPKISYTGDDKSVAYVELGFSDAVAYITQFQGLGFDDVRSLSQMSALWAHMMGEERALLFSRGSVGNGYLGSVAAPSSITPTTSTTGGTIPAATYSCYLTANTGFGESVPSTVATQVTTGSTSTITLAIGSEPNGAINYNLYVGTTAGIGNAHFQGTFTGASIVLTSYNAAGAVPAGADTSFSALGYDGILTVAADTTQSGYVKRVNAALSTSTPGKEFEDLFTAMYAANGADPDELWMTGAVRQELSDITRVGGANGAANGYRTTVQTGGGVVLGTAVTGLVNPQTQKVVDARTHRFMPAGAVVARSLSLPIQDSHVPAPSQVVNVQDYMAIDWPQIQMSYDLSTYQIGTVVHYAPSYYGALLGVA